jgi:hypothetical protein
MLAEELKIDMKWALKSAKECLVETNIPVKGNLLGRITVALFIQIRREKAWKRQIIAKNCRGVKKSC